MRPHELHEIGINGRNAAQHDFQLWIHAPDRLRRLDSHIGEHLPVAIYLEVPMRKVIGFVPEHYRFNHDSPRAHARHAAQIYKMPASSISRMYWPWRATSRGTHNQVSGSGWAVISNPELRNIASAAPRLGSHQLVGSLA